MKQFLINTAELILKIKILTQGREVAKSQGILWGKLQLAPQPFCFFIKKLSVVAAWR
jgi:hypothetical protein